MIWSVQDQVIQSYHIFLIFKTILNIIIQWELNVDSNLDVAAAHVVLVALQRQVPVLRVDETN